MALLASFSNPGPNASAPSFKSRPRCRPKSTAFPGFAPLWPLPLRCPAAANFQGVLLDEHFLHEGAVLLEHLDAIILPVANVDETVLRDTHTVHRITELL